MDESFSIMNDAGFVIKGIISRPKPRGKFPLVVIASDFFDTMESPNVKETVRLFLLAGFAVARFDYTNGFGQSDGYGQDITISQSTRDIEEVVKYAKRRAYVNEKKTVVLGFAFGALCSLVMEAFSPIVQKLLLFNTPNDIEDTSVTRFSERDMMRIRLKRYFHVKRDGRDSLISYTFFEDGAKVDIPRCARNLKTPTLFMAGKQGSMVPPEHSKWFYERVPAKTELAILDVGDLEGRKGIKAMVDCAVDFL